MIDLYGPLLEKALFPAFEAARGRPTVELLRSLVVSERWSRDQLVDVQTGFLRRLMRHAYNHTSFYRELLDDCGLRPEDFDSPGALTQLPILDRDLVRSSLESRTSTAPPFAVVTKSTSGTSGEPITVRYNAESRYWRDATRWRGYGWSGYRIGMRAMHYWGAGPANVPWIKRQKANLDHLFKRDLYVDCTPRGEQALTDAVAQIRTYRPQVMVAYAAGAAALARFVNERQLRDWSDIPVLVGAERLWPHDREAIIEAFGPAFETYGCREVMMIGSECEAHDGLHTAMETMIVEVLVRGPGGSVRAAKPGEIGEVAITDLHNLACPMVRYVTGDLALARAPSTCSCGRNLDRIGPIEGRITETMRDGHGNAVSGLVFSIIFAMLGDIASKFQVVQRLDGTVLLKVVPNGGENKLADAAARPLTEYVAKYLPGVPFVIEYVDDIPLTAAGKRKLVVVEKPAA